MRLDGPGSDAWDSFIAAPGVGLPDLTLGVDLPESEPEGGHAVEGEAREENNLDGVLFIGIVATTGATVGSTGNGEASRIWILRAWTWNTCWNDVSTHPRQGSNGTNRGGRGTTKVINNESSLDGNECSGAERVLHLPGRKQDSILGEYLLLG